MYVSVKAVPNAKKEKIEKISNTEFVISVKEKAERNLANRKIVEVLSNHFNIALNKIKLVGGHRSYKKVFSIDPAPFTSGSNHTEMD